MSAGMAAFQSERHHFYLGVRREGEGWSVFLERAAGNEPESIADEVLGAGDAERVELRISASGGPYAFSYRIEGSDWKVLAEQVDGSILSTDVAGGFVGSYVGLHARLE